MHQHAGPIHRAHADVVWSRRVLLRALSRQPRAWPRRPPRWTRERRAAARGHRLGLQPAPGRHRSTPDREPLPASESARRRGAREPGGHPPVAQPPSRHLLRVRVARWPGRVGHRLVHPQRGRRGDGARRQLRAGRGRRILPAIDRQLHAPCVDVQRRRATLHGRLAATAERRRDGPHSQRDLLQLHRERDHRRELRPHRRGHPSPRL